MLYRLLCNDDQREGVKSSPDLAFGLFCYVPVHKIRDGIDSFFATYCNQAVERDLVLTNIQHHMG